MADSPSSERKSVLLTAHKPKEHPLATIFHDANNKLSPIVGYVSMCKSRLEKDRLDVISHITEDIRFSVEALFRIIKSETIDLALFLHGLEFIRKRIGVLLPHIQGITDLKLDGFRNKIENAISELDALMERGLMFVNDQRPKDKPTLGNISEHTASIVDDYQDLYPRIHFHSSIEADCEVSFHPPSMKRTLENLLINAIQALPEEGGEISIKLEGRSYDAEGRPFAEIEEGAYVSIEIIDNGSGISEEVLDTLPHSTITTREDGSGFGLASVKKCMIRHDGHLIAESEAGCGTTVTALIPSSFPPPRSVPAEILEEEGTDVPS